MKEFVKTYKEDSNEAKRNYYKSKLNFDVGDGAGKVKLHKLLYRYLEGLQWVLYYYYKGAPHWRWYYPYHYAPMISDLGAGIVDAFLGGKNTITEFKTDAHCNENPKPYTAFQQLLCIFPIKSLRLFLPPQYLQLAQGELSEYFPDNFEIDLNGRTLPWEAVILIPFVDEDVFIQAEAKLFDHGMKLSKDEWNRNTSSFKYPSFYFDKKMAKNQAAQPKPLESMLTQMDDLPYDFSRIQWHDDYENVGTIAFPSALLKGVTLPMPDYPSMFWCGVKELDYAEKFVNKVAFKQCLAVIPQTKEDASGADFEDWIYKFAESKIKELYVKFPYQVEAFPLYFEDPFSIYQIQGDPASDRFNVIKLRQTKSQEEFQMLCKRIQVNHSGDKGLQLGEKFNTLVTLSTVIGTEYDDVNDQVYKLYSEETMTIPFNLVMKKRSANHYLNVNERVNMRSGRIKNGKQGICFNPGLLGVKGTVKSKDIKKNLVKVEFNIKQEESKVHHPFFSENFLRREFKQEGVIGGRQKVQSESQGTSLVEDSEQIQQQPEQKAGRSGKTYFGDQEIEQMLKLPRGLVNRLTGSFLVAFDEKGKEDRQVVDCGLNIKNFTKKVHVPDFVRFVAQGSSANTIYDDFQHNQHARGSKHIRKHWEYSIECMEIIQEYAEKYPEIIDAIQKCAKKNKAMNSLFDIYPDCDKKDKQPWIDKLRETLNWIEQLPLSKLPYVEMGFDSLETSLIEKLADHSKYIQSSYGSVDLKVRPVETIALSAIYQEQFPYYFGWKGVPDTVNDFRVGNRVMNLNSSLRKFIPFGARGSVVGKTDSTLIVLFDDQFLHGNSIYGHCQMYRGAQVNPAFMLNLSREFARLKKDNYQAVNKFQEKPLEGFASFADENKDPSLPVDARQLHLEKKFSSQPGQNPLAKQIGMSPSEPQQPPLEEAKQSVAQTTQPKPQAQIEAQPEEEKGQSEPQVSTPAEPKPFALPQAEGGLFKAPLPGLKVLDPKLINQPQFQKIIQTQNEPEESATQKPESEPLKDEENKEKE